MNSSLIPCCCMFWSPGIFRSWLHVYWSWETWLPHEEQKMSAGDRFSSLSYDYRLKIRSGALWMTLGAGKHLYSSLSDSSHSKLLFSSKSFIHTQTQSVSTVISDDKEYIRHKHEVQCLPDNLIWCGIEWCYDLLTPFQQVPQCVVESVVMRSELKHVLLDFCREILSELSLKDTFIASIERIQRKILTT